MTLYLALSAMLMHQIASVYKCLLEVGTANKLHLAEKCRSIIQVFVHSSYGRSPEVPRFFSLLIPFHALLVFVNIQMSNR